MNARLPGLFLARLIWLMALPLLLAAPAFSQKPDVKTIDKTKGGTSEIVTIKGENFGSDATQLSVFFGAAKGTIESVSGQVLEARVPPGATVEPISVINKTSGLTGYSKEQFNLTFGGDHPFLTASLEGQFDFNAEQGLYDLCLCDFDGDGRVDVATASDVATSFKILPNTSSGPGNVNFNVANPSTPLATRSLHAKCGDLNGDGKPDLVISEGGDGDRIFIFKNNSTGTGNFAFSSQFIKLTGRKTKRIGIADLDLDGKPELIVTDQGSNIISVLQNASTLATIAFAPTVVNVTVTGAASTDGLEVIDLNGDERPEIITSQFLTATSNLFVIENKSVPGTISMGPITTQSIGSSVVNIRAGDFDGDSKADIAVTQLLSSTVSIFLNQSTTSSIAFASPKSFLTEERPWGIDIGDLDGDGKTDIVVASLTKKFITVLNNESTTGNLVFQTLVKGTTFINRHVNIGDLDGDGKPDVAFTSIDDNNNAIPASRVSVFRNKHCLVPEITPEGPLSVCSGFPLRLHATVSRSVLYEWTNLTTSVTEPLTTNPYLDVTVSGRYQVRAISESGTCSNLSNEVEVTISAGAATGTAVATNNGPLCVGNALQLEVNDVAATEYRWTGPNGYTGTGLTPAPINNFQPENVGRYYVEVVVGTCVAQKTSTIVEAIDIGNFQVTVPGANVICQGDTKVISVAPTIGGASYQWFSDESGLLGGQVNPTLTVSTTGTYYVEVSYPGCGTTATEKKRIVVAAIPVASFTSLNEACAGQQIQFTNQSTVDPNTDPVYLWTFGDGNTSTEANPQHTYLNAGNFNVKLRVSYTGDVCPNETTPKQISVQAAPVPSITNPENNYGVCPGGSIVLQVLGTYNSYVWSNGSTDASITVEEPGTYSVEVTTNTCTLNAEREVTSLDSPPVLVTADPQNINEGQSAQLNAEGLVDYEWSPEETLSDATIANPVASPVTTTTYTVNGAYPNGCIGTGTITISVKGDAIVTKLEPKNFFSLHPESQNQQWRIENILDFPQCGVTIYDSKGIKIYEAKPYLNDWDGTFNGKILPNGVYYFIIKCDGEESTPRTGSITLLK